MKRKFLAVILFAALISLACSTRVSEWILLNSSPHEYSLIYFHKGSVPESVKSQNQDLAERITTANIQFKTLSRQEIADPYYGLYYEGRFFSKYKTVDDLRGLSSSPLRQKVAAELMAGKLCVMLYLKTDDREKDEKGLKELQMAIAEPRLVAQTQIDRRGPWHAAGVSVSRGYHRIQRLDR